MKDLQFFVAGDTAQRLDVLFRLLLDDVDDVVDGDDADQAVLAVDHGGSDEVVLAEQPRHLLLIVEDRDLAAVLVDQIGQRDGSCDRVFAGSGIQHGRTSGKAPNARRPTRDIVVERKLMDRKCQVSQGGPFAR